jgi:outer membrane protein, heavy metal efflux system
MHRSRFALTAAAMIAGTLVTGMPHAARAQSMTGAAGTPFPEGPPLSLHDAIAEALERSPDLAAREAAVDAARHRPAQERALDPPMLGAEIWQWPVSSLDPRHTGGYMLMVEQSFPGRGKRALREQAATAEIAVLEHEVATDARMVVEAVTQAYIELALARASAGVYRANLDLLRQLADNAQARYAVGRVAQPDVLQPVIEISRIYDRLIEEEERAALGEARLNRWMGRAVDAPIGALDRLEDRRLTTPVAELQRLARDQQPVLQTSAAEVERAAAMLAVAESGYRPDFAVQGGYMIMPREGDTWTARVAITWPRAPWARRGVDARVAEARQAVTAARAGHDAIETDIRLVVQEAYVRVKAAERRTALLRTSIVPQIEQTFAVVRAAYQADRADLLSVIDTQRLLLDTRLEQVQAAAAFSAAMAALSRAVGADLDAHLMTVPAGTTVPDTTGETRLP